MRHSMCITLAATAGLGFFSSGAASACGLDGIPSLLANGQRDRVNTTAPTTSAQLANWTPFVVSHPFTVGHPISLTEDRVEVAKTLTDAAMRRPWRWRFSDGSLAYGWTVKHAFTRPGPWRVTVDAFYPGNGKWYPFDTVSLTVTGVAHR